MIKNINQFTSPTFDLGPGFDEVSTMQDSLYTDQKLMLSLW